MINSNINFPVFIKLTKTDLPYGQNMYQLKTYYVNAAHIIVVEDNHIWLSKPEVELYIDQTAEEVMTLIQNKLNLVWENDDE